MEGLLIVGHGSRSRQAVEEFETVVGMVRERATYGVVAGAHMELASPDIPTTVMKMVQLGVTNVTVVPYFLFNGNHIKHDIPEIIEGEREKYSGITFSYAQPIGAETLMADILLKRASEARQDGR